MTNLTRVQMLLEPDQHAQLKKLARQRGMSVAEITRQAINLGLESLKDDEIRRQQREALEAAREFSEAMLKKHGRPLDIDVVADLNAMREERLEQLAPSRR